MVGKIEDQKFKMIKFISKHKLFSLSIAVFMFLVCFLPFMFNNINAEEKTADEVFTKKKPLEDNSEENPYILDSIEDIIALQEFSKTNDCNGLYFYIGDTIKQNSIMYTEGDDEEGSTVGLFSYNLDLTKIYVLKDGSKAEFNGIGQNYKYPFRGNIKFNGISVMVDTPLFCFLGSGASITQLSLFGNIIPDTMHSIVEKNASLGFLSSIAVLDNEKPLNVTNVSILHKATITGTTKSVGGLIGTIIGNPNSNSIDINHPHFTVNLREITIPEAINFLSTGRKDSISYSKLSGNGMLSDNYPGYTGGIIGDIVSYNGSYLDVNFTGHTLVKGEVLNTLSGAGGVIGHIGSRVCVKFDGEVDVSDLTRITSGDTYKYKGSVIGSIDRNGLAYMTPGNQIKRPILEDLQTLNEVDTDIAGVLAGFIYKNTSEGFFNKSAKISGEGTKESPYILSSAEDVERLSVVLCTEGVYGIWYDNSTQKWDSWFNVPTTVTTDTNANILKHIREAHFLITNDIDLSSRNILRINRTTSVRFAGSIIGQNGDYKGDNVYPTITLNNTEYQEYSALIGYAGGRIVNEVPVICEYKNFNIEGNVESRSDVSGLIYNLTQSDTAYCDYIFENINMNLNIKQKTLGNSQLSGFITVANYGGVTTDLSKGLELSFKDINFNGSLIANSNGSSSGGVLISTINPSGNDKTNVNDINQFTVNVNNYHFTGEIKCISKSGMYVSGMIGTIANTNNNKSSYNVAGLSMALVKRARFNINNVTFENASVINGEGSGTLGGILGYSWDNSEIYLNNVTLSNVTYDSKNGPGALLLYTNYAFLEIDWLNYDNVKIIRRGDGGNSYTSAMLWNNTSSIVVVKNHNVTNSKVLFNSPRYYFVENVYEHRTYNGNQYLDFHGLYTLEGYKSDNQMYSAVNSYESPYIYTDINTETATNYKNYSYKGTRMQYNVISNMQNKYIQGKGTIEDPFIIDDEAKLVLFSNINNIQLERVDYFLKYFKDIEGIFTENDLKTLSFLEKRAKLCERMLTGVYVFAKSMDLSEYSYYPANNCTGDYYGFDVYTYLNRDEFTEDELRQYCSNAIKVLESESTVGGLTLEDVNNNKPDIHFDATRVANGAMTSSTGGAGDGWNKPCSSYGIHSNMQSGLFGPITGGASYYGSYKRGNVKINNLKLSGEIAGYNYNYATGGGAFLITGCCHDRYPAVYRSVVDIKNIDFQNAFITNRTETTAGSTQGNGLLIDTIGYGNVNISNVKVLKNDDGSANIRADALIGYQYGSSTRTIFRNIDLNAVIDQGTITKKTEVEEGEQVIKVDISTTEVEGKYRMPGNAGYDTYGYGFRYGYYYFYLYEGAAIYWYEEDEDIVTPGIYDINDVTDPDYANRKQSVQNKVLLNNVQKYAYKVVNVDVNPQSANIIHGSGTETDPYIINNVGQLITLANFIKYEGDIIDYSSWYVGEINNYSGYDDTNSNTWADNSNLLYEFRKESDAKDNRLQAVKKLCSSYYKITADIDFSDPTSAFSEAAINFNGIGTNNYPFSGVVVGALKDDGTYPSIIFGSNDESYMTTFGLIQYAKGMRVQNLNFVNGYEYDVDFDLNKVEYTYTKTSATNKIYVSDATGTVAGMVAACIIGGDNIIENVNVNNQIQMKKSGVNKFKLGGYVGYLKRGTLRVSGINNNTFKDMKIGVGDNMDKVDYSVKNNQNISAIAGKVEAAYIMYYNESNPISSNVISIDCEYKTTTDASGNTISEISDIGYYNINGVPGCRDFNIINMAYLDAIDRIKVVKDERVDADGNKEGALIAKIENEDQLFLYSLALGSGALSSSKESTSSHPYSSTAACRKYSDEFTEWLNNENANKTDDNKITLNENYNFPAVFKYFDFTALDNSYLDTIYGGYSMLNMLNAGYQNDGIHRTTYLLTKENSVYDMSGFGSDFVGIGMRVDTSYSEWDNTAPVTMCANFDGNKNTIKIAIKKSGMAGLFPVLNSNNTGNSKKPFLIKNFTLEGSVEQLVVSSGNCSGTSTAGVVGYVRYGFFTFDNIKLQNMKITNKAENNEYAHTAGIMGQNDWYGYAVKFKNITIGDEKSNDPENVLIDCYESKANAGGLFVATNHMYADTINMYNTTIKSGIHVGGLAAGVSPSNNNYPSKINLIKIMNCTFETRSTTGGVGSLFGYLNGGNNNTNQYVAMHDITIMDNDLKSPEGNKRVGRVVGFHSSQYYSKKEILKFKDKNSDTFKGPTSNVVWNCENTNVNEDCDYIYHNEFYELTDAEKLYKIDKTMLDENNKPIIKYDECIEDELFTYDYDGDGKFEPVDLITSTERVDNNILRWSSDSGTLESVLNSILYTLTNGTGILNGKVNDKITVNVESLQIKDGKITTREKGNETISITLRDGKYVVANNNKYDTFEKIDADGNHIPGTFSVVHVKYSIGNGTFTEDISIPVFVSKMVNVDIYTRLVIGEEYNANTIREIRNEKPQTTTMDSSYTIYTEFMYSSNRIEFDEELYMNKGFMFAENEESYIPPGIKLTLIDLTYEDEPKTYYYELEESDIFVPLTKFTDENGKQYKERNINILDRENNGLPEYSSYEAMFVKIENYVKYNRGVEKYLLFVDCRNAEGVVNEGEFAPIITDGVEDGQNIVKNKEVFYVKHRVYDRLYTYNKRKIKFVDNSIVTEGEISKEKQLNVKVDFTDTAPDERYWDKHKDKDYNNKDKYVEAAVYLKNEAGEKVMLPSGTRIKYGDNDTIYEAVKNTSSIFYFKDGLQQEYALTSMTGDSQTTIEFTLDFTYAKMDRLPSGNYTVCFDLVRTTNPLYPMGDDILDTIESSPIGVTASAEYGFRLDTKGKDTLAFNIADVAKDSVSEVDFGLMLSSTLPKEFADNKKAVVKFNLYKKNEITGYFEEYQDSAGVELTDIELEVMYNENSTGKIKLNEVEYEYAFEDISGKDEEAVVADCKLVFPYGVDINNYKLQAELYIDGYKQASDFFIVNIADIAH